MLIKAYENLQLNSSIFLYIENVCIKWLYSQPQTQKTEEEKKKVRTANLIT